MLTDSIADLLTRIRNAQRVGHRVVTVRPSKMNDRILTVLKDEGFIDAFESKKSDDGKANTLVHLRYFDSGRPVIKVARRVSKPGRRVYAEVTKLPRVASGLGIAIVSTSQGVFSDREARKRKIGGEVLATIQ